jgi:WD40 repeat protein
MDLLPLRRAASDVARIVHFFTGPDQGYQQALTEEIPLGASSHEIRNGLGGWFADSARRKTDCVVVYIAGHGDQGDKFEDHCLFTSDSALNHEHTILRTSELVRWILGGKTSPLNILLILDVCYAGAGAGETAILVAKSQAKTLRDGGAGFWIIAASDPNTEAGDGTFVDAFLGVVHDDAWSQRGGTEFLSPGDLTAAINERLTHWGHRQRVLYDVIGAGRIKPPFIRNRDFTLSFDGFSVADQAHWTVKARGTDFHGAPGWYFTGRINALRELTSWLRAPISDGKARVVTGRPGSGKSAVLGWLVLATHPETFPAMQETKQFVDPSLVVPNNIPCVRIHARGAKLNDIVLSLSCMLRCKANDLPAIIAELMRRSDPIGIILDSLDEASQATSIEKELLEALVSCPAVRLIVGTRRRNGRIPMERRSVEIDLDKEPYFNLNDLETYIFLRLTSPEASAYASPVHHINARRISALVAERASFSFLYARLVARRLIQIDMPVDTTKLGWESELNLPSDVIEAFGADLDRFDKQTRQRFVDLLIPLAYARGKGLPQKNLWYTVASRIAGREYTNGDIRELKEKGGFYLVQDTERGEVVFRLFHETFAQFLKELTKDEAVEQSFSEALLSLVPLAPPGLDAWSQVAQPYLLNYIPAHAAAASMLDDHLSNPDFLLHVIPESLLAELPKVKTLQARQIAKAYRSISHWIRGSDTTEALPYLIWQCIQHGAQHFVERLTDRCAALPWVPRWTAHQPMVSSVSVGRSDEVISAITAGIDHQKNPIAVCGYGSGKIRVWNLSNHKLEIEYGSKPNRDNKLIGIKQISLLSTDEHNFIIVLSDDGSLSCLELSGCTELGQWRCDYDSSVRVIIPSSYKSEAILVGACRDMSLRLWSLPSLAEINKREKASAASFYSLVSLSLGDDTVIVSGSDSFHDGHLTEEKIVRIWSLPDLELCWSLKDSGTASELFTVRIGESCWLGYRNWLDERVVLIDPRKGHASAAELLRITEIIGVLNGDNEALVVGARYSELQAFQVKNDMTDDGHLSTNRLPIKAELAGSLWGGIVKVNGMPCVIGCDSKQVLIWDLDELLSTRRTSNTAKPEFFLEEHESLTALAIDEGLHLAGSTHGNIWAWDRDGNLIWKNQVTQSSISGIAFSNSNNDMVGVLTTSEGLIYRINIRDGSQVSPPLEVAKDIRALSVKVVEGHPMAFMIANIKEQGKKAQYVVRVWDLEAEAEVNTTIQHSWTNELRHMSLGEDYHDKLLHCITSFFWDNRYLVAFAGAYGMTRIADLSSCEIMDTWTTGDAYKDVRSVVAGVNRGKALVFTGDEKGRLFARDVAGKKAYCPSIEEAHRGAISTLRLHQTREGVLLLSGGNDGIINIWTTDLHNVTRIEAGRPIVEVALGSHQDLFVATDRGVSKLRMNWPLIHKGIF